MAGDFSLSKKWDYGPRSGLKVFGPAFFKRLAGCGAEPRHSARGAANTLQGAKGGVGEKKEFFPHKTIIFF